MNRSFGESYGLSHTSQRFQCAWLRPSTPITGLYLSGQDVLSAGVTGALAAGMITTIAATWRWIPSDLHKFAKTHMNVIAARQRERRNDVRRWREENGIDEWR